MFSYYETPGVVFSEEERLGFGAPAQLAQARSDVAFGLDEMMGLVRFFGQAPRRRESGMGLVEQTAGEQNVAALVSVRP